MKTTASAQPLKIIVVEDNAALLAVTLAALAQTGHHLRGVGSTDEFFQLPDYVTADVAIIDLNLPGEDGICLAKRFRAISPKAGIIMVTARTTLHDRMVGYETGADIYLPKPVQLGELVSAVNALGRRISHAPVAVDGGLSPLPADLTPRLLEIGRLLLGTALGNKEIAEQLALHEGTVRKHIERLYRALGVNSRAELSSRFKAD
jgi:DNA-binding NarL/FixJ family response regulator